MRHRLAALAVVLLVALPAWLGADPQPASPPFPIWPIPREARVADTRLLLTEAVIVVPPGEPRAQAPGRLLAEIVADEFGVVLPVVTGSAPEGRRRYSLRVRSTRIGSASWGNRFTTGVQKSRISSFPGLSPAGRARSKRTSTVNRSGASNSASRPRPSRSRKRNFAGKARYSWSRR